MATAPPGRRIQPGSVCDCLRGNQVFLVYVDSLKGESVAAFSEHDNRRHRLNLRWLENPRPPRLNAGAAEADQRALLAETAQRVRELAGEIDLETLWAFRRENDQADEAAPAEDYARLWFGDALDADRVSALLRLLAADTTWFRRDREGYVAQSEERVAEIQSLREKEARRRNEAAGAARMLREGRGLPPELTALGEALRMQFLRLPEKPGRELRPLLEELGINPQNEQALYRLLVRNRLLKPLENFHRERFGFAGDYPDPVRTAAEQLPESPPRAEWFRDLTALPAYTVDEERTLSYDDAFWLDPDGKRLFIHIAHPPAWIDRDSPLWEEARRRGTSVFFPGERREMFPPRLADDLFSLVAGRERAAITLEFPLTDGQPGDAEIYPSRICVTANLSYDGVDRGQYPEGDPAWAALQKIGDGLRAQRESAGALLIDRQELELDWDGEEGIELRVRDRSGSRLLVEELMVLANTAFARWFITRQIPAIYRGQTRPPDAGLPADDLPPALRLYRLRRLLGASETGPAPLPHAALGVEAYLQATSPIRRFADLLLHRQLAAVFAGKSPLSATELEAEHFTVLSNVRDAALAERQRRRYLLLHWVLTRADDVYGAVVLDTERRLTVRIDALDMECECVDLPPARVEPGAALKVRVKSADPLAGSLKVQAVEEAHR